jgi:WD40 repeat protein
VNGLAFSENGRFLASSHSNGAIFLYDGATGEQLQEVHCRENGCRLITATHHEMAFLHTSTVRPNEGSSAHVGTISYHSLHDNRLIRVFRGHENM